MFNLLKRMKTDRGEINLLLRCHPYPCPFTLYIRKFEKNEVVNIFTFRPKWVKCNIHAELNDKVT